MGDWKTKLIKFQTLLDDIGKSRGNLKFDKSFLAVHELADQTFCEKAAELTQALATTEDFQPTEQQLVGKMSHEKLTEDGVPISFLNIWKEIYERKNCYVHEMLLAANYQGVGILGKPDLVYFESAVPRFIFEFKFSKHYKPFANYHVQAQVYGYQLNQMGFDTTDLFYAFIIAKPRWKNNIEFVKLIPKRTMERFHKDKLYELDQSMMTFNNIGVYINKFIPEKAIKELDFCLGYWLDKRKAIPTQNKNKCRSCKVKKHCKFYLMRQDWKGRKFYDR